MIRLEAVASAGAPPPPRGSPSRPMPGAPAERRAGSHLSCSAQVQGAALKLALVVPPARFDSVRNTVPTRLVERLAELIVVVTRGVPVVTPVLNRRTCELPVAKLPKLAVPAPAPRPAALAVPVSAPPGAVTQTSPAVPVPLKMRIALSPAAGLVIELSFSTADCALAPLPKRTTVY